MTSNLNPVLTDEQWTRVRRIFEHDPKLGTHGRPSYRNHDVFECVLRVIATGTPETVSKLHRLSDFLKHRNTHREFI